MNPGRSNQCKPSEDVNLELECDIEEDVEAELEEFVRLSHTGQFSDAHELFDECLSSHIDWYPVAAEYADCLLREGSFRQLQPFCFKVASSFTDNSETRLLDMMQILGDRLLHIDIRWQFNSTRNGFLPRDKWRKIQSLWSGLSFKPPFTISRDSDIHLLEVILQILVLSGKRPADLGDSLIEVPLKGQDTPDLTGQWSVFKHWFCHLLQHQYFWEAQCILRSLFYVLPRLQYVELVQHYFETAVRTNISQEPVQIAASSLVQHSLYAIESEDPNPCAVVQWNDAVTWALFGITLTEAGVEPASLPSRICLRLSLPEKLGLKLSLPLDGAHRKHQPDDYMSERLYSLHEMTPKKETSQRKLDDFYWEILNIAVCLCDSPNYIKKSYELDEDDVYSWALLHVAQYCPGSLPLQRGRNLNPRTVNAQDSYKRTPLHWASLNGQIKAVEILLRKDITDIRRVDWFGSTPLHYAVKSCSPGREINYRQVFEALLKFDSAAANTKDSRGLTPLRTAIQKEFYGMAESLLRHGAIPEEAAGFLQAPAT